MSSYCLSWSAWLVVLPLLLVGSQANAAEEPSPLERRLTIDRLFGTREFDPDPAPLLRWSPRAGVYYTVEKANVPKTDAPKANVPKADAPKTDAPKADVPKSESSQAKGAKAPAGQGHELLRHDAETGRSEVLIPASALVPAQGKEPLAIDGFEVSADESKVLIYTNSQRVWRRNTRGDYWLYDVPTKQLRKLGADAAPATMMFAKFSPDGSRIAYVRDHNLYVQDLHCLEVTALTRDGSKTLINGTADWVNEEELSLRDCFRWSPDGRHLLFWQFDTSGVPEFHLINNVVSNSPRLTTFAYPKVGEKNSATRLGVIPSTGGTVTWLELPGDPREHYLPQAEWTPDGSHILVQQFNRLQSELRVWLADPKTGKVRKILTETDSAWIENDNPVRWLDGGKAFLWISERSGWRHAYRATLDGAPLVPLTQGAFDLLDIQAIDTAGGWLYYSASPQQATQRYLYRVPLAGGGRKPELVSPAQQTGWHLYDFSPDARYAVHTWSNFTTPPTIELVRLSDRSVVRTWTTNGKLRQKLAQLHRPHIEFFQVDIGSGVKLDGWTIRPEKVDASAKLPLLMYVYGEPHGQTVRDAWSGARGLWHWMLAQQGFVVASVDNRGTNVPKGREWRKCVHRQLGILPPQDQAQAVLALLRRWKFVDPSRVGVWGWSGGGSMSLNAMFRYPFLYRTGVAVAPMPDMRLYDTIYQERYMGLPQDNAKNYREGSPITHARKLRGNLLLIHGTGDDNCHYQATERLIDELIANGKRFSVMPYPNRTHAIREGHNTERHLWETITQYLRDNLQAPHAPEPMSLYETRSIRGWKVLIARDLLLREPQALAQALELLEQQLDEIIRVVPKSAVEKLQRVPLYFNSEYPGASPKAEYHPGAGWLREHQRDPAMAKAVEFTNVRIFAAETNRMPNFVLHELAHAYHDRELPQGFGNPQIQAAFARAKDSGKYDKVERYNGLRRPRTVERAYAMTNPMEYFAETTEAYFSRNDFFPFDREQLRKHDPEMFDLLGKLWGVEP